MTARLTTGLRRALGGAVLVAALVGVATALFAQSPADRSRPPQLGPVKALSLPPVVKRVLSNGLPVWVVEARETPLVQVNLVIHAGSGDDPALANNAFVADRGDSEGP